MSEPAVESPQRPRRRAPRGRPIVSVGARELAGLLAAAEEEGCLATLLSTLRVWQRGKLMLRRVRELRDRLGSASGYRYALWLLEVVDQLAELPGDGSRSADVLAGATPPPGHLLLAAQLRLADPGPVMPRRLRALIERLEEPATESAEAPGLLGAHGDLAARIARLEAQIAQLVAAFSGGSSGGREPGGGQR